jgi:hypothetical protein
LAAAASRPGETPKRAPAFYRDAGQCFQRGLVRKRRSPNESVKGGLVQVRIRRS